MTSNYYRGSQAVAIVYDITDRQSFTNVNSWIQEIHQSPTRRNTTEAVVKVLIANKSDLEDRRAVPVEEGRALAAANKVEFFETSAKDGNQVMETFHRLVAITLAGAPARTEVEPPVRGSFALSVQESEKAQPKSSGFKCCK